MKNTGSMILMVPASLALAGASAWAQSPCEGPNATTFTASEGVWQNRFNWDNFEPDDTMVACIPDGKVAQVVEKYCSAGSNQYGTCTDDSDCPLDGQCVTAPAAQAGAIRIDGQAGGVDDDVKVFGTLRLHGHHRCNGGSNNGQWCDPADPDCGGYPCEEISSRIIGKLWLSYDSTLEIVDHVTMLGDGGTVDGEFGGDEPALITGDGTFTIQGDYHCVGGGDEGDVCYSDNDCDSEQCLPVFVCDGGDNPGQPCDAPEKQEEQCGEDGVCRGSLLLNERLTIDVELINNASIISTGQDPIVLTGATKRGDGFWKVTNWDSPAGGGGFVVDCELEFPDSGLWQLGALGSGARWQGGPIEIETRDAFLNLDTGADVEISGSAVELTIGSYPPLTQNFLLSPGTLKIHNDFKTTGDLRMQAMSTITLDEGYTAEFDVDP